MPKEKFGVVLALTAVDRGRGFDEYGSQNWTDTQFNDVVSAINTYLQRSPHAVLHFWAPEPFSFRMTNLYFIAASPDAQGAGAGTMLLKHIEGTLRALGPEAAQTLIVETSSTQRYAATREFYRKRGFVQEATIRRFYGPDDHKVVFWKSLID